MKAHHREVVREEDRLFAEANAAWDRKDLGQAFTLFERAAKLGDISSQLDLGYFYDNGLAVRKNRKKALEWYHKAYRQGNPSAANNIATIHRDLGDKWKMLWWFRRAVAMGYVDVLIELGKCYENGLTVEKDLAQATRCYHRVMESSTTTADEKAEAKARLAGCSEQAGRVQ